MKREQVGQSQREPAASPEELALCVETQRHVAALVLELDEPFRQTVLLRYYEGLSSPEIAQRMGVPEGTARQRLSKALGSLRERLDGEYGDRSAWSLLFAPLVDRGAPLVEPTATGLSALVQGILVMHTGLKVTVGALAVLLGLVFTPLGPMVVSPFKDVPDRSAALAPSHPSNGSGGTDALLPALVENSALTSREPVLSETDKSREKDLRHQPNQDNHQEHRQPGWTRFLSAQEYVDRHPDARVTPEDMIELQKILVELNSQRLSLLSNQLLLVSERAPQKAKEGDYYPLEQVERLEREPGKIAVSDVYLRDIGHSVAVIIRQGEFADVDMADAELEDFMAAARERIDLWFQTKTQ